MKPFSKTLMLLAMCTFSLNAVGCAETHRTHPGVENPTEEDPTGTADDGLPEDEKEQGSDLAGDVDAAAGDVREDGT